MIRKVKRGFTLVEVSLFLAVTGLLFLGIAIGIQGSLFQQRYNDAVQSFAEFLRSVYSQTTNVENISGVGSGRSNQAIYGKLIVFGETEDFEGNDAEGSVFVYTVVGNIGDISTENVLSSLNELGANIIVKNGDLGYKYAGVVEEYFPRWGAGIQTTQGWSDGYNSYKGAVLIVRHPRSGTVFTYSYDGNSETLNNLFEINDKMAAGATAIQNPLEELIKAEVFKMETINFCVNPEGENLSNVRRNIRIIAGARNASGVEIIGQNDDTPETGNLCK